MTTNVTARFLVAADLAELCGVDLKSIHNWVDAGKLVGFRTPGRHLRFRYTSTVAFLEQYEYPVPAWLRAGAAREAEAEAATAAPPGTGRVGLGRIASGG